MPSPSTPPHTTQHQVYKLSGSSIATDQFQSSLQQFLMQLSEGTLTPSGQWKEQLSTLIHFSPHLPLFSSSSSLLAPLLSPFSHLDSFLYLSLTSQRLIPFHSILLLFPLLYRFPGRHCKGLAPEPTSDPIPKHRGRWDWKFPTSLCYQTRNEDDGRPGADEHHCHTTLPY